MLNENIVSLLIPCYNGEQFVERCLINVLEQEYAQYIELIWLIVKSSWTLE